MEKCVRPSVAILAVIIFFINMANFLPDSIGQKYYSAIQLYAYNLTGRNTGRNQDMTVAYGAQLGPSVTSNTYHDRSQTLDKCIEKCKEILHRPRTGRYVNVEFIELVPR